MYLTRRSYLLATAVILLIASGYVWSPMYTVGRLLLLLLAMALLTDALLLWHRRAVTAQRQCNPRFSNGDDNRIVIGIDNASGLRLSLQVIDEVPFVFQRRDVSYHAQVEPWGHADVSYTLRPTERGEYGFGNVMVFASTRLALIQRRYRCGAPQQVKVFPNYLMLRQYELLASSSQLRETGPKRVRRIGHQTEFEQIKDYVTGDDFRTINWRATARRHQLMVNVYQEERSQQVFSIIDKGRMMQQAHQGMTLLDYAINASLVLSYVALHRDDRVGLITFSHQFGTFVPALRKPAHMRALQEALYAEQTTFGESDFTELLAGLNRRVKRRSLLILFTSFTGASTMQRQLPYLRQLAQSHRLLVVFFEDAEMRDYMATRATDTEDYYQHVIAEKFAYEQRLIVQKLRQYGILSLLTTPAQLTVGVVNRYLEVRKTL